MSCLRRINSLWLVPVRSSVSCLSHSKWPRSSLATWASWCPSRKPSRASRASLVVSLNCPFFFFLIYLCFNFFLWLVILNFLSSVYNLIAFFVLISFQVSMMLCPSKPSTWSVQLRRWFRKLRNWLRSTHKHPDNLTEGKREE